jgi:hypothetical protein
MTAEQAAKLSLAEQHDWYRRATSRRSLLRGGVIGAGTAIAGAALLDGPARAVAGAQAGSPVLLSKTGASAGTNASPFGQHIAFGADPRTEMAVAWQVRVPVSNPFLRVGTTPWDLSERIEAEVRTVTTQRGNISPVDSVAPSAASTIEQYYLHVRLDKLRAGKTYFYTVGHEGWDTSPGQAGFEVRSFTTAPRDRGPFRFTAFGDEGISYDAVATTELVRAQHPDFHLHAGDISYAEGTGHGLVTDSYDPQVWDLWFNEVSAAAGAIPWQIAVGNHEMEAWYSPDGYGAHKARFDFPGGTDGATYYAFTYGNVGVITLDANDVSYELPANFGYSGGAQTAWLKSTLASLRAQDGIDFIVVQFHHCTYSTCTSHASEGGARQYWAPLFDKYSVDLVINGHNHIYERTDPMKGGGVTTSAPAGSTITPATEGTTYVVAGGAGNSLYSFNVADSYEGAVDNIASISSFVNSEGSTKVSETVTWSRVRYTGYCLLVIDSTPAPAGGTSTLLVRGLAEDGTEIDRFTLARTAESSRRSGHQSL